MKSRIFNVVGSLAIPRLPTKNKFMKAESLEVVVSEAKGAPLDLLLKVLRVIYMDHTFTLNLLVNSC